jgi:hypothetical protein
MLKDKIKLLIDKRNKILKNYDKILINHMNVKSERIDVLMRVYNNRIEHVNRKINDLIKYI